MVVEVEGDEDEDTVPAPPPAVVDSDVIAVVISGPVVSVRAWVRLWLPSPAVDAMSTNCDDVTMLVVVVVVVVAAAAEVVEVECDEDEVDDEDDGVKLAVVVVEVVEAVAVPSSTAKPPLAVVDAVEFVAAVISAPVVKVTPMVST